MSKKLTYQFIMASLLVLTGIVLLFIGLFYPPVGEIHNSVLIAFGEACTFAGALVGVDYHYRYRVFEDRLRESEKRKEKELEDEDHR